MNQNKTDLRDLTEDIDVTFVRKIEREGEPPDFEHTERRFRLREHSRSQMDRFYDLTAEAEQDLIRRAEALGTVGKSHVETIKQTLPIRWAHLSPVVAFCLAEPLDGLPRPTAAEIEEQLCERKALTIIAAQENLNGISELVAKLSELTAKLKARKVDSQP